MNRSKLKTYAPQARRDFIRAMTDRAAFYGLSATATDPVTVQGDVALIGGKAFPASVAEKRQRLQERVQRGGFDQTMEAMAYTWFNRLVAIRYMELHGYLDHGYRVLSHPEGKPTPEIVEQAEHVDLPGLDSEEVINLKLDGTKEAELYRKLLIAQCNALHAAMPFLFERIADETELLLPDSLLHSDSLVRKLVTEIDEADWQAVEIIGWLYQFYISDRMREVIGSVVKSEDIPAATQLFTPNWIVKYLVQNSLGRQWLATYPHSPLKAKMEFYIEPAEQTPEVQAQLKAITPENLNPEELTFLDPACGSGHILVEAYSLLRDIYLERGYRLRDIPKLILTKNLFGLEIDDRAAQLAAFALLMMARADDRNILSSGVKLKVLAIQQTDNLDTEALLQASSHTKLPAKAQPTSGEFGFMDEVRAPLYASSPALTPAADPLVANLRQLLNFFKGAKTFGSLLQVPPVLTAKLPTLRKRIEALQQDADLTTASVGILGHFLRQADLLARQYGVVAANPPYMGSKYYTTALKTFVNREYSEAKADLYACFMERNRIFANSGCFHAMINIPNWMFVPGFEDLRVSIFAQQTIDTFVHNGRGVFGSDFGSCAFVIRRSHMPDYRGSYRRLFDKQGSVANNDELECRFHTAATHTPANADFAKIPGSPVAYWVSDATRKAFAASRPLSQLADPRIGMSTCDNSTHVRKWWEVAVTNTDFACTSREQTEGGCKWFPFSKGGEFRKWYGNSVDVVNWQHDGKLLQTQKHPSVDRIWAHNFNLEFIFKPAIVWTKVTISSPSFRWISGCHLFDEASALCPVKDADTAMPILGLLCSKVVTSLLQAINPSINLYPGDLRVLPVLDSILTSDNAERVSRAVENARADWNSFETSWDFDTLPILGQKRETLRDAQKAADSLCSERFARQQALEEENNRHLIDCYGLQGELSPELPDDQITIYRPDHEKDMRRLVSYALGCAMGRYSLDKTGLIYANSGNEGFDPAAYVTLPADKDGIVPITEEHWFADDAAARFEEFVVKAWPVEHLDENLAFVAEGLGAKASESSRQTIRRYLLDGFYKHHLSKSIYKNRPIYWVFTSGKHRAFQAFVYLHRYNEGTLSRMRTEYVIPLQGKIAGRIEKLEADKAKATSTSYRKSIEKEQDKLRKQQQELVGFDEKLRHYADLRIKLDLDDGVKVNYRKFADPAIGEIVADMKAVCGKEDGDE